MENHQQKETDKKEPNHKISHVRNINIEQKARLSTLEKSALFASENIGTVGFFIFMLLWTIVWLTWNIWADDTLIFDPAPGYAWWFAITNAIQLLLLPLLLFGQNIQARHAEARAEADFEVNNKAEKEIEKIISHLEKQDEMLNEIRGKLSQ